MPGNDPDRTHLGTTSLGRAQPERAALPQKGAFHETDSCRPFRRAGTVLSLRCTVATGDEPF